jgi:hypothetical protein
MESIMFRTQAAIILLAGTALITGCNSEPSVSFKQSVHPVIDQYCAECHVDEGKGLKASGFRVDSYDGIMKGTHYGPVIIAGSPESSTLYRLVAGLVDKSIRMPHSKEPMKPHEIAMIGDWIEQGAQNN